MPENDNLTEREREILNLVATGASNKQIALALRISLNTVKVHLRNIFDKIGVTSRTEATLYALRSAGELSAAAPPAPPAALPNARRWIWWAGLGGLLLAAALFWLLARPLRSGTGAAVAPVRWQAGEPLPLGRTEMAGAAYQNHLYLIGGRESGGVSASGLRLDLANGTWQPIAPKPTPARLVQAAVLGEKIYVPGGCNDNGQPGGTMEVYDPRHDRWETRADLPIGLCAYSLAALEGQLYVFGGWDGERESDATLIYDPATDRWRRGAPLPVARQAAAAAVAGEWILVAGGQHGQTALQDSWAYYPTRDQAGESPWQARAPLPRPRSGMASASLAGMIFLAGGSTPADGSSPLLEYLPTGDRWIILDQPPQAVGVFPVLLPVESRLHLLGGALQHEPAAAHQSYQAVFTILIPVVQ